MLWAGVLGLVAYIGGWALSDQLRPGHDPTRQAISELFAMGEPWASRGPVLAGLVVSGVAMAALAPALHRALPGSGRLGPGLVLVAGVGTLAVAATPCSPGCPGTQAGGIDAAHTLAAGVGYLALTLAPVAFAWRLRHTVPWLAAASAVLGGTALAGLAVRYLGVLEVAPGLQQRVFNTVADAWYLLVAAVLLVGHHRRVTTSERGRAGGRGR